MKNSPIPLPLIGVFFSFSICVLASAPTDLQQNSPESRKIQHSIDYQEDPKKQFSPIYAFDFYFLLDNLEGSQPFYWPTRTLFSAAFNPEIGISFYNQSLKFGVFGIVDMGHQDLTKNSLNQLNLTLSYDFNYKGLYAVFGIFSTKSWIGHYSKLFYRTDNLFYSPTSSGIMFQYQKNKIDSELIIDWTGGDLLKRFDEFDIQGFVQKSWFDKAFYIGSSFLLYHFLNSEFLSRDGAIFNSRPDTYLLDRFYYEIYSGSDLARFIPFLDTLSFEISNLASFERKRTFSHGVGKFSSAQGFEGRVRAQYRGFGIENSIYLGQGHLKYFREYGTDLYAGLPFYQSTIYDRAEIYYQYTNNYLTSRLSVDFHFTPIGISNQVILTIQLDSSKLFKHLKR